MLPIRCPRFRRHISTPLNRSRFFAAHVTELYDRCDKMDTVDKVGLTMFVAVDNYMYTAVNNIDRSRKRRHQTMF